jgi:hypothetical protein
MKFTGINSKIDASPFTPGSCRLALKGRRNRPEKGEQGTTLVEIVVAGAILAVGPAGLDALLGPSINEVKTRHTVSGAQGSTSTLEH